MKAAIALFTSQPASEHLSAAAGVFSVMFVIPMAIGFVALIAS
ncbi:hypothetical protein [Novosphingobium ovatum]|nr:hypothetical protein [Novosphingobium ovatum]